jgi:hypothetical protein
MGRKKSAFRFSFTKSSHQDGMKSKKIHCDDINDNNDDDFLGSDNILSSFASMKQQTNNGDDDFTNKKDVTNNIEETHQEDTKEESRNETKGRPSTTSTAMTTYSNIRHTTKETWNLFLLYVYEIFGMIYSFVVISIANLVTSILTQPQLQDAIVTIIVRAINTWTDQENIGSDIAQKMVLLNREHRLQASREVGKEVIPLISGFVGGVAHSLKPAAMKTGKETKKTSKSVKKKDSNIDEKEEEARIISAIHPN